jgi:hypothetical protein
MIRTFLKVKPIKSFLLMIVKVNGKGNPIKGPGGAIG